MTDSRRNVLVGLTIAAGGLLPAHECAHADYIIADERDALAEEVFFGPSLEKIDDWDGRAGEWFGGNSAWVMPFQLPDLGAVDNPFVTASFRSELAWKVDDSGGELDNIDLYALDGTRSDGFVMHEDYGAPATLIQDNFITPGSADWTVYRTNGDANTALADYLNAAYAGGAGAGEFVFLRFTYDGMFAVQEAYTLLASNAGQNWEKPTIEYTLEEQTIVADLGDALAEEILSGISTTRINDWDGRVGEWFGGDSAWIMPFQIPDLGAVNNPFEAATFRSYLVGIADDSGGELDNVDLYALDAMRSLPEVFHEDYSAPATLIQDDYYTPDMITWREYKTNASGDDALLSFLNAAYAGGANVGQFVFLRMTYDGTFVNQEAYRPTAANAGFDTEHPTIIFEAAEVEACPCDWNADGMLNSSDLFTFLLDFDTGDADFNGDGMTNSGDLFGFLACFDAAPAACLP